MSLFPRQTLKPGVYFGLSQAEYDADPALRSTAFKQLITSPAAFWQASPLNSQRTESGDSPAKRLGRAVHTAVLEGEAALAARFAVEPSRDEHPGVLDTVKDIQAALKAAGRPVSGAKPELIARLREAGIRTPVWDEIIDAFRARVERDRLETLKPDEALVARTAALTLRSNPVLERAFSGGAAEVSVVWTDDDGLPMKCRYDYVKPQTILDLKTFSTAARTIPVDLAVRRSIADYRYDLSARHYLDGWRAMLRLAAQGQVFGQCPLPRGWHTRMASPDDVAFTWVFLGSDAPVTRALTVRGDGRAVLARAARDLTDAKHIFRACLDRFGTGTWADHGDIETLGADDMPAWMCAAGDAVAVACDPVTGEVRS